MYEIISSLKKQNVENGYMIWGIERTFGTTGRALGSLSSGLAGKSSHHGEMAVRPEKFEDGHRTRIRAEADLVLARVCRPS